MCVFGKTFTTELCHQKNEYVKGIRGFILVYKYHNWHPRLDLIRLAGPRIDTEGDHER